MPSLKCHQSRTLSSPIHPVIINVKDWKLRKLWTGNRGQLRSRHNQSGEQVEETFGRKFATKMFSKSLFKEVTKNLSLFFSHPPLFWNICKHIVMDWIKGSLQRNKYKGSRPTQKRDSTENFQPRKLEKVGKSRRQDFARSAWIMKV